MAGGGGAYKKLVIDFMVKKPHFVFIGGAAALHSIRYYSTQSTYNYWFGKIEYERRMERGALWFLKIFWTMHFVAVII